MTKSNKIDEIDKINKIANINKIIPKSPKTQKSKKSNTTKVTKISKITIGLKKWENAILAEYDLKKVVLETVRKTKVLAMAQINVKFKGLSKAVFDQLESSQENYSKAAKL